MEKIMNLNRIFENVLQEGYVTPKNDKDKKRMDKKANDFATYMSLFYGPDQQRKKPPKEVYKVWQDWRETETNKLEPFILEYCQKSYDAAHAYYKNFADLNNEDYDYDDDYRVGKVIEFDLEQLCKKTIKKVAKKYY